MNRTTLQRVNRINQISAILKRILSEEKTLDEEALVLMICDKHNCSRRTAKEYFQVAKARVTKEFDKQEEEGEQIRAADSEPVQS